MAGVVGVGRLLRPIAGNVAAGAVGLIGNEWDGFALDFLTDTSAVRVTTDQAEELLGSGPDTVEPGLGISFLDNSVAVVT